MLYCSPAQGGSMLWWESLSQMSFASLLIDAVQQEAESPARQGCSQMAEKAIFVYCNEAVLYV